MSSRTKVGDPVKLARAIAHYRDNPVSFVEMELGVDVVDEWQQDVLNECAKDQRVIKIAMSACAGPGKTCCMAWILLWFISTQGDGDGNLRGAAMSITRENLNDNLWAEVSLWYNRSDFLQAMFEINAGGIYARDHRKTWFISTRSFGKTAKGDEQASALSGIHAKYVLFLIDESGEISTAVARKAEQAAGGAEKILIVQSGNPTVETGMLYEAVELHNDWTVFQISADPDDSKRTPRVDPDWAQKMIDQFGREDPWVMIYVLGKFPPGGINKLLSAEDVDAAMDRHIPEDAYTHMQKRMGIDAARFGDDPWVIFPRQGRVGFKCSIVRHPRTAEMVRRVLDAKERFGSEQEFFDDTGGWAVGVIDGLIESGYAPVPVNFSSTKVRDDRFYNVRAEMYWNMAEWIKSGGSLPRSPELREELLAPTYSFKGNKIVLESKDQIRTRIGRSIDRADALALTFYYPDISAESRSNSFSGACVWDYDPLDGNNRP